MEIVINTKHGGFGLSSQAMYAYAKRKGLTLYPEADGLLTIYWTVPKEERAELKDSDATLWRAMTLEQRIAHNEAWQALTLYDKDLLRTDEDLTAVVKALGAKANSRYSDLKIVVIPDDVEWCIKEYDGIEWVAEAHRVWE